MKNVLIILAIMLALPMFSIAQVEENEDVEFDLESLPPFTKNSQFGILFELNNNNPSLDQNNLSQVGLADRVNSVTPRSQFGIGLGIMYAYEVNDFLAVRVQPMLSFSKSEFEFDLNDQFDESLIRESVNLELPLHFVLENINKKVSPSLVLGGRYRYNIAQNTVTSQLAGNYNNNDLLLDAGAGISFQFDNFRFKTELLYSHGLLDQIGENTSSTLAAAFGSSNNRQLALRFMFYM